MALRDALVAYSRFCSCLLPYLPSFVVADFDQVTRDFGAVTRRLNERFGTSFAEFVHNEANIRECWDLIRERPTLSRTQLAFESGAVTLSELRSAAGQRSEHPQAAPSTTDAWVPSAERERSKAALREQWQQPPCGGGLSEVLGGGPRRALTRTTSFRSCCAARRHAVSRKRA